MTLVIYHCLTQMKSNCVKNKIICLLHCISVIWSEQLKFSFLLFIHFTVSGQYSAPKPRTIYINRNKRVMLDHDLARMYEVETRILNQQVKRNIEG